MPTLTATATETRVVLRPPSTKPGLFARLIGGATPASVAQMSREDWALGLALSDLRALAEEEGPGALEIGETEIRLSHPLVASLDGETAATLGLPPLTDMTFETGVSGILGDAGFRLDWLWSRAGRATSPARTGSILHTEQGDQRIPRAALDAIAIAEAFDAGTPLVDHWSALARFRRTLRPDEDKGGAGDATDERARIAMTGFLDTLRIASADAFSMNLKEDADGGVTFDPLPFSRGDKPGDLDESDARLSGPALERFQREFGRRGASTAYPVGDNEYLVVERGGTTTLAVMARKQRAQKAEREAFITNPTPALIEEANKALAESGALDGEDDAAREALVEESVEQGFVQTPEYLSARVVGIGAWRPPDIGDASLHRTTWLPEAFTETQRAALKDKTSAELESIREDHTKAVERGDEHVIIGDDVTLPTGPRTDTELGKRIEEAVEREAAEDDEAPSSVPGETVPQAEPIVLQTKLNFDALTFGPERIPRAATILDVVPAAVTSTLMAHQRVSFDWQVAAWREGAAGLLNADEPGLGKTLQTLAFLAWLREAMAAGPVADRRPLLVVAPTSLLMNWEKEVTTHMDEAGLGSVLRLYGSGVATRKSLDAEGKETDDGIPRLDFRDLQQAIEDGRGHDRWVLTTYTTLTNYQHSFGSIRFAAAIFDEIQAVKNPATLAAAALRSVDAGFRIGLTGTPIENRLTDIWAIMDQLSPGTLASLKDFRQKFEPPTEDGMIDLNRRIFERSAQGDTPLGIRRLKTDVATDLPPKLRLLHPRVMPPVQASTYLEAHEKAASSPKGGALKALQHIRSVSAHPGVTDESGDDGFIAASARLAATVDLLEWIQSRGERALVFIEHVKLQHRFAEIVRRRFGLENVRVINGKTPAKKRQPIVDHFQRHGTDGSNFDVLILAPKAAGTGLTLTAACHVIHLSRWWNPAVEEQCNDRTHRIGQTKPVTIHVPLAIHPDYITASFDCLLHDLMRGKRTLAAAALWPAGDVPEDIDELLNNLAMLPRSDGNGIPPDINTVRTDAQKAGFKVEMLKPDALSLRSRTGGPPLELQMGTANGWSLSEAAAARITIGSAARPIDRGLPPLTVLDGDMVSLWPRYMLDG